MMPYQFIQAIAEALERVMTSPDHEVYLAPLGPTSNDKDLGVFPMSWTPVLESGQIGQKEPPDNEYLIRIQNLTICGDDEQGYEDFTLDQRKIRAILYRDATLSVALAGMQEVYLGSTERFSRMHVVRQSSLQVRQSLGMYFLCETDVRIDTQTTYGS